MKWKRELKFKFSPFFILILALSLLFIRNLPLCFIIPIWSHGDEIGHLDYVFKLNQGHLPYPTEFIESSLFILHKRHYDSRYLTKRSGYHIKSPEELGLAAYSYEANQPPLPYLIMALFRYILICLNTSLLLQVKFLRIIPLLAISCGLVIIYLGLKRTKIQNILYYYPLLFIPLLAQDMFFSINTDAFSFLFGSLAITGMIYLFKSSYSQKGWIWLTVGTSLALWTKATNVLLFIPWLILTFFLWQKKKNKRVLFVSLLFLIIAIILSSPWYIYNQVRFSNPFIDSFDLDYPLLSPQPLSISTFKSFTLAFTRTLFRGEFIWHGHYFDILHGWMNIFFISLIPLFVFIAGFLSAFIGFDQSDRKIFQFFILCATAIFLTLFFADIVLGGIPHYHARYSFASLYFIMFVYAAGWRRLLSSNALSFLIPVGLLLAYNLSHTIILLSKVI